MLPVPCQCFKQLVLWLSNLLIHDIIMSPFQHVVTPPGSKWLSLSCFMQAVKRKPGKPGRPRTVNRLPGGSQDVLRSPAADARCQVGVQAPAAPDCHLMSAPFTACARR
jgi:hypothetical protein